MAVQFTNVESLFFLPKSIGQKNPLLSARIANFRFAKFKGGAKKIHTETYKRNPAGQHS